MFPSLSVLCAVIGVMVLFIVLILSTRVVESDERYRAKKNSPKQAVAGTPDADIEGIDSDTYRDLEQQLKQLSELLDERESALVTLSSKLAGLEDLLEYKKTEQMVQVKKHAPRELAQPEPVAMVPDQGYKVPLQPIFLEVKSDGYTVRPSGDHFAPVTSTGAVNDLSKIVAPPELHAFVADVAAKQNKEYLVFLVHPNGVQAYQMIRRYLIRDYDSIRIGWEPFSRVWVVTESDK
jgi:hypothetical protein